MLPGWNQIRQARLPNSQPGFMPGNHQNAPMMGGGNPMMGGGNPMMSGGNDMMGGFGMNHSFPMGGPMWNRQPFMQQAMYQQPNMNSYPMNNQMNMMMNQQPVPPPNPSNIPHQPPPPAPAEPPPSKPAAPPPPPSEEKKPLSKPPPPPPDAVGEWWKSEMDNLNESNRDELQRLTQAPWFLAMSTSQQIECWQHKMQLKSKEENNFALSDKSEASLSNMATISKAPQVNTTNKPDLVINESSVPGRASSQIALEWNKNSGENPHEALKRYQDQLQKLKEQGEVFEKQYNDWHKQFNDWKIKHQNHPNKAQFKQYEQQWVTWQDQMEGQKKQNDANKERLLTYIAKIEQVIADEKQAPHRPMAAPLMHGNDPHYGNLQHRFGGNQFQSQMSNNNQGNFPNNQPRMPGSNMNQNFQQVNSMMPNNSNVASHDGSTMLQQSDHQQVANMQSGNQETHNQSWQHHQNHPSWETDNDHQQSAYEGPHDSSNNASRFENREFPYSDSIEQKPRFPINSENQTRFAIDSQRPPLAGNLHQRLRVPNDNQQRPHFPDEHQHRPHFPKDTEQKHRFPGDFQPRPRFPGDSQQRHRFPGDSQNIPRFLGDSQQRHRFPGDSQQRHRFPGDFEQRHRFPGDSEHRSRFPGDSEHRHLFPGDSEQRPHFPGNSQERSRFPGESHHRSRFPGDSEQQRHRFPGDSVQQRHRFPGDSVQQRQRFPGDSEQQRHRFPGDSEQQRHHFPGDSEQQRHRFPGDSEQQRHRFPGDSEQQRHRFPGDSEQQRHRFPGDSEQRPHFSGDSQQRFRFPGDSKQRSHVPGGFQQRPRFSGQRFSGGDSATEIDQNTSFDNSRNSNQPNSTWNEPFANEENKERSRSPHEYNRHGFQVRPRHPSSVRFPGSQSHFSQRPGNNRIRPHFIDHNDKHLKAFNEEDAQETAGIDDEEVYVDGMEVKNYVEQDKDSSHDLIPPKSLHHPRFPGQTPHPRVPTDHKPKNFQHGLRPQFNIDEFGDNCVVVEDEFNDDNNFRHEFGDDGSNFSSYRSVRGRHTDKFDYPQHYRSRDFNDPNFPPERHLQHHLSDSAWDREKFGETKQSIQGSNWESDHSRNKQSSSSKANLNLNTARQLAENNPLFSGDNLKKLQEQLKMITGSKATEEKHSNPESSAVEEKKILEKAKTISSVDLKNILSAVKSVGAGKSSENNAILPRDDEDRSASKTLASSTNTDVADILNRINKYKRGDSSSTSRRGGVLKSLGGDPLIESLESLAAIGGLEDDLLLQEYLQLDPLLEQELYLRAMHDKELLEEARRLDPTFGHAERDLRFDAQRDFSRDLVYGRRNDWSEERKQQELMSDQPHASSLRNQAFGARDNDQQPRSSVRAPLERRLSDTPFESSFPQDGLRMDKHFDIDSRKLREADQLDLERKSIEKRHEALNRDFASLKQQQASLDDVRKASGHEEERKHRERSLERLRIMEDELRARERDILERERILREALHRFSPRRPHDDGYRYEEEKFARRGVSRRSRSPHRDRSPHQYERSPDRGNHDIRMIRGRGPSYEREFLYRGHELPPRDYPPHGREEFDGGVRRRSTSPRREGGRPYHEGPPLDDRMMRFRRGSPRWRSPPRRTSPRHSPSRRSPRRTPPRRSPPRRSPLRRSPPRRSPLRRSPPRRSPLWRRSKSPVDGKDEFGRDIEQRGRGRPTSSRQRNSPLRGRAMSPKRRDLAKRNFPPDRPNNTSSKFDQKRSSSPPTIMPLIKPTGRPITFADLQETPEPVIQTPLHVNIEDVISSPGRLKRPPKIAVILRGLPGSGKTHIAKMIRDKESGFGVSPRVLGLDDYFMTEVDKTVKDPKSGKNVKKRVLEYEYEEEMEQSYRQNLIRSFKKTLEDGYFTFVIMDAINDKIEYFEDCYKAAKASGFEVYVADMDADVHVCSRRNVHQRSLEDIQSLKKNWEETPSYMNKLDLRQLVQDSSIQEVEMGDITDSDEEMDISKVDVTPKSSSADVPKSRWETESAASQLDKLDGIRKKSVKQSMDEFLSVTDDYSARKSAPGKKRVRWADINERQNQQRMRDVGFVVGQTDWSRMMDDSHATQALNRTKFI